MIDGGLVWFVQFDSRRVLRHGCDFAHAFSKFVFLAPFCARLKPLQGANFDEFTPITKVADFVTLLGTYSQGFTIIVDPYPEAQGSSAENIAASCSFYPSSMSGGILCKFNSILRLSEHEVSTTQH